MQLQLQLLLLYSLSFFLSASAGCGKPPVLFVFGDSNSDTGGAAAAGIGFPIGFPHGRTFFHRPSCRVSDGRLLIDLLCQSLNTSLLVPYLDALSGTSFTNGANFAVVGSSTLPKNVAFSLYIQVTQFRRFKARTLQLLTAGARNLINDEGFRDALYLIDIGQNDLEASFSRNLTYAHVLKKIPAFISEIENAVKSLYNEGARNFWIHNTGPLGCLPKILVQAQKKDLDSFGCLSDYNSAARFFNEALLRSTHKLINELKDATLVYVDIYAIKYDLFRNASKYGFSKPLMACCGYGGPPYNFDEKVVCGQSGYQVCDERDPYVSWDGIHYTEAANTLIASGVLSMAYSTPRIPFNFFCRQIATE